MSVVNQFIRNGFIFREENGCCDGYMFNDTLGKCTGKLEFKDNLIVRMHKCKLYIKGNVYEIEFVYQHAKQDILV